MSKSSHPDQSAPRGRRARLAGATLLATLGAFAAPAVASATERWVDAQTGSDSGNNCKVQANPCATIMQASNNSQMEGNFGTIHVDQGTYAESVTIAQANVLAADDFVPGDSGATTIAPASGIALFIQANATATGFEITSPTGGTLVLVSNNAKLIDNKVVATGLNATAIDARDGAPTVEGNTVLADSGDEDNGIVVQGSATDARILDNVVGQAGTGFGHGIWSRLNSVATIEGNQILGARQDTGLNGKGILLEDVGTVTVRENLIASPTLTAGNEATGIEIDGVADASSVKLSHNRILGMTGIGLSVLSADGEVSSEGDLVAGNSDRALYVGGVALFSMTNDTIAGNVPMEVNTATVAIDSSVFDVGITSTGGEVVCDISHTRGPAITAGGNGCAEFQTTADPKFADPMTFDYHLGSDSPLIDAGNPAAPPAGAVDIDGEPRAVEGDGACPIDAERDMGYDEVMAPEFECPDPPVEDKTAPDTSIVGKRKQFGRKARFAFVSTEAGSTFECRLDRGKFRPCDKKFKSRRLNYGRHTVFARATDAAGNTDATPAAFKFKLKERRAA